MTSALDAGELSASCACSLTLGEDAPGTHRIGGRVGPTAGPDAMEKRQISCFCQELNSNSSAVQPVVVTLQTALSRLYHRRICRKETIKLSNPTVSFDLSIPHIIKKTSTNVMSPPGFEPSIPYDPSITRTSIMHVLNCASTAIGTMFTLC
jgi:hypothetical protein